VVVQNSYDLRSDRGLSDFDARHRLVLSGIYDLPFRNGAWVKGWQIAGVFQYQSGNPVNIVTSDSTVNGIANTLRPNSTGPTQILGSVEQWFDTSVFETSSGFGDLGRNVVIGPPFSNSDMAVMKNTKINEHFRLLLRAEIFDVFNRANFGQP